MRWFRLRRRTGSWLAVSALLLQLALTFGHVHLDRAAPLAADAAITASAPSVGDAPEGPAGPDNPANDHCAICALIHLAGSLVTADAPSLPLPVVFDRSDPEPAVAARLTASHYVFSQARAPPIA